MMLVEAFVNPKVLVWARKMAGLDHAEAAQKAGVKPERLHQWEEGVRRPTINQARKLSDVYKRPLAVFFLEVLPPDDVLPQDFRRIDPNHDEPLSPQLRLAIRNARARRDAALELFGELEERPPDFLLAARLSEDPESLATRLRNTLTKTNSPNGCDPRVWFNFWRAAVERAGVLVLQAEDVKVSEIRGFSISERPLPVIVVNIKDAYVGRTFSMLHELAHVMLNRGGMCIFDEGSGQRSDDQRIEAFCNHVAGAVLLPADVLLQQDETPRHRVQQIPDEVLSAIAQRFGTSEETVLRRFAILDRVSVAYYQRMRRAFQERYLQLPKIRSKGGFAAPHTIAVATSGKLFTRLVLQAYDDERITASDVAGYLGLRLKHLEKIRTVVRENPATGEAD